MKWQTFGETEENIRSIFTKSFSKFSKKIEEIFLKDVNYSGIVITGNPDITGEMVEKSCYNKGGFKFIYKSYEEYYLNKEYQVLADSLGKLCYLYAKEININPKKVKVESCWAVNQEEGDYGTIHNHKSPNEHKGKLFSGMIYLKIPETVNPSTFPNGCLHLICKKEIVYFPPIKNSVVIWPSETLHGIHPFRGNEKRIGIAFNTIIEY